MAELTTGGRLSGIFAAEDPYALTRAWLAEAAASEPEDANAVALATIDAQGLPNLRMVLLKEIEHDPVRPLSGPDRRLGLAPVAAARQPPHAAGRGGEDCREIPGEAAAPSILGRLSHPAGGDRVLGTWRFSSARPVPMEPAEARQHALDGAAAEPVRRLARPRPRD